MLIIEAKFCFICGCNLYFCKILFHKELILVMEISKIAQIFRISYFKKYSIVVFVALFTIMAFVYNFDDILFLRPQSIHQWRQCDCLSFAMNYYNEDVGFFEPQVHYLATDGTGRTVSDFPLVYFFVAKLWKVFGHYEFIYRLVVLSICFVGLLALMKLVEDLLKDSVIALFISLLMYTSTILVYYSNNFLMNVPSFSMALIAIFFFYKFYKTDKDKFLYLSMMFYSIGALLKIPALTSYFALSALFFLEFIGVLKLKRNEKLFKRPLQQIPSFLAVLLIIFAWYFYAYSYNNLYNKGLFLIGILPIWDLDSERVSLIFEHAKILWFESYHSSFIQYLSFLLLLTIIVFNKKVNRVLILVTGFLTLGFILFILLWFDVFAQHDYYLVNQLILMIAIFVTFFHLLKTNFQKFFANRWFRLALLLILVWNVSHCKENIYGRYHGWQNDRHRLNTLNLENITPYLDSVGVSYNDKVLFISDGSFNIPLYLMNRKGYTVKEYQSEETILSRLKRVDYLICNDSSYAERLFIKEHVEKQIGEYKNISIYSLKGID